MAEPLHHRFRRRLKVVGYRYGLFTHHFNNAIRIGGAAVDIFSVVASLVCIVTLVVYVGYDNTRHEILFLRRVLGFCQGIFVLQVFFGLLFRHKSKLQLRGGLRLATGLALLTTAVQYVYPHPQHPWLPILEQIVYSRKYTYIIIGIYSVIEFSHAIMRLTSRRTNPSLLLTSSFLFFIIVGSFALMLPRCTVQPLAYIDSLFLATSTVCITGLTPVDVSATFTPTGLAVMAVLIQIGGIGVLTFTSFFALFFSGATSVYNQLLIRDMVYSKTMNALIPTLMYIIAFTLTVEAIGAVAVYFTIPEALGLDERDKLVFAAFHSLSAFCNAGFSSIKDGMANPALMTPGQGLYNVTSVIILAGAIGFPILVNFKDILFSRIRGLWRRMRGLNPDIPLHLYDLNTKLVLVTTFSILIICSAAFFFFEYSNTLRGMTMWQKLSQSVFNSLVPRSAGFASVNPSDFLPITLMMVVIQMWIGGASQSLAGGIKVNTVAAIALNIRSVLSNTQSAWAFDRSISLGSTRRANTVLVLAIVSFFVFLAIVMTADPQLSLRDTMFEVTSALFTVGSSLGVTSELSFTSKLTLCIAMLLGRVGIISILAGFFTTRLDLSSHLPEENVIIN